MGEIEREEAAFRATFEEIRLNGRAVDWGHWVVQLSGLNPAEASRLMVGLCPDLFADLAARPTRADPGEACRRAACIERIALDDGWRRAPASDWLQWAESKAVSGAESPSAQTLLVGADEQGAFDNLHAGFKLAVEMRLARGEQPTAAQNETPAGRRTRRLQRLMEIGGAMQPAGGGWRLGGRRGALAALVREEAAAGRPMSKRQDVRRDLDTAMAEQMQS